MLRIHLQHVQPDLARRIAALAGEQARLQAQQAQGVVGAYRRVGRAGKQGAGVSVQACGNVHGQHRRGPGVHMLYPLRHLARWGAGAAQAQQGVDGEVGGGQGVGRFSLQHHAGLLRTGQRSTGIGGCRLCVAEPGHPHCFAPAVQVQGSLQPVAAVVAGAAGHPDGACMGRHRQRQPRHGQAGALHQGVLWQAVQGEPFDLAAGLGVPQRPGLGGVDGVHGQHCAR